MPILTLTFPPGSVATVFKSQGNWVVGSVNTQPVVINIDDVDGNGTIDNAEWDAWVAANGGSGGGNDRGDTTYLFGGSGNSGTLFAADGSDISSLTTSELNDIIGGLGNTFETDVSDVVCFTAGTLIRCPQGDIPVEALRPGDLVITADRGAQPVRWIGRRQLGLAELMARPGLRPVRIAAGSIAPGVPDSDLWVSPEHRLLLDGFRVSTLFDASAVLATARSLTGLGGIGVDNQTTAVEYIHIMFDQHEIVWSNGTPTESFHATASGLDNLAAATRAEVLTLFPELRTNPDHCAAPARALLSDHEAALMV
ncbi:Hint domain-containing protein [Halovulum sp. GXIMD14793]